MVVLTLIISAVILVHLRIKRNISLKRLEARNALISCYDKMEMYVINNDIDLDRKRMRLMYSLKNLKVNPELLDIQVLLMFNVLFEKRNIKESNYNWFDEAIESMGEDFLVLFKEFDNQSEKLIKLSLFKYNMIIFLANRISSIWVKNKLQSFRKLREDFREIIKNDQVIAYRGMELVVA